MPLPAPDEVSADDHPQVSRDAAARLANAAETGVPCAPVRDLLGTEDLSAAYATQQLLVRAATARGDEVVGRKIGLTSTAVQSQLGVDQPDFGTLLSSMIASESEAIPGGRLLQPRIEAEIAFVLGRDIDDENPSLDEIAGAVASVRPAFEIVDSRIRDWDICITDTIADNASSGIFVLGEPEVSLSDVDPVTVEMTMTEDGVIVSSGTGEACLGNPLVALQWLAGVAARLGAPLRAGEIVLSGALGPVVPVRPGANYKAEFIGLGNVRASFAGTHGEAPSGE